jgi:hypothetical protein
MFVHLVCFDVPFPANYGGAIVVFNRLRALQAIGVQIVLHCFVYGDREPQPELERYCAAVHYYRRSRAWWYQLGREPFIVRTRRHPDLLRRLADDRHPILFEGLHTTAFLGHPDLGQRPQVVLMHNVEWQYYRGLGQSARNPLRRAYFYLESLRLRRYERAAAHRATAIVALSPAEAAYYRALQPRTVYVPAFHGQARVESAAGRGTYALFHGNLSVADNERAAAWLVRDVFAGLPDVRFVVAGLAPPERLRRLIGRFANVELIENPGPAQMQQLVHQAQIHTLVSFQAAGVKLKLIHALFAGRFCLVNEPMVRGTDLGAFCRVENDAPGFRRAVQELMAREFEPARRIVRKNFLEETYDDRRNAAKIAALLGG